MIENGSYVDKIQHNEHFDLSEGSEGKSFAIVLAMVVVFSVAFSIISYLRYLTLNQHVFDLGVNAELAYSVLHGITLPEQVLSGTVPLNKLIYVPIGIIYGLYPREYMLLFYQDIFLSLSGIFIYLIGDIILHSRKFAIIVALLWFLYYPMSGVYWFDFHYMAFFPTLFLSGVYFWIADKKKLSVIMLALAATTDLMSPVLVVLFVIIYIIKESCSKKALSFDRFQIIIIAVSLLLFLMAEIFKTGTTVQNYIDITSGGPLYSSSIFKSEFLFRVLLPLFFIPVIGIEYLFLISPYVALIFSNSYWPYESQLFFQYPSLYVPTLFVSFILGLKRLRKKIRYRSFARLISILLIFNIILFALFTPIGNILTKNIPVSTQEEYITGSLTNSYPIYDNLLPTQGDIKMIEFMNEIPQGSSVLVSGNLPELMQGFNPICTDSNLNHTLPQYIPVDPYSRFFTYPPGSNNSPVVKINYLLNNFHYGFVNAFEGMIVYELNLNKTSINQPNLNYALKPVLLKDKSSEITIPFISPGSYTLTIPKTIHNMSQIKILNGDYGNITCTKLQSHYFTFTSLSYITTLKVMFTSEQDICAIVPLLNLSATELVSR